MVTRHAEAHKAFGGTADLSGKQPSPETIFKYEFVHGKAFHNGRIGRGTSISETRKDPDQQRREHLSPAADSPRVRLERTESERQNLRHARPRLARTQASEGPSRSTHRVGPRRTLRRGQRQTHERMDNDLSGRKDLASPSARSPPLRRSLTPCAASPESALRSTLPRT